MDRSIKINLAQIEKDKKIFELIRGTELNLKEETLEKLIIESLTWIKIQANKYQRLSFFSKEDLISEGIIGLLKAINKFNPEKGSSFKTYATYWVKQEILRSIDNRGKTIRIPVKSATQIREYKETVHNMENRLGRKATENELAKELNYSLSVLKRIKSAEVKTTSLNARNNQNDSSIEDYILDKNNPTPSQILSKKENISFLFQQMKQLKKLEHKIINMRFGFTNNKPKKVTEISRQLGIPEYKVKKIELQSIEKLKFLMAN